MNKKNKCATALLATALLSYGFTLNKQEEIPSQDPKPTTEVAEIKEPQPILETKVVVESKKSDSSKQAEQPFPDTSSPTEPKATVKESPPPLTPEPTQSTTPTQSELTSQPHQPPDTSPKVFNVTPPKAEEAPPQNETPPDIPEQPPTCQTEDVLHEILNDTYNFKGDELIYTQNSIVHITYPPENPKPVYVDGFGWVEPTNEPSIRIEALDMAENGNKVGTMGGG